MNAAADALAATAAAAEGSTEATGADEAAGALDAALGAARIVTSADREGENDPQSPMYVHGERNLRFLRGGIEHGFAGTRHRW